MLIFDPFVRLHRVDENVSAAVAPLLDFLRHIQRRSGCAIAVVHHSRKGGAARAGQALRGSSEFHAWGDSNLYLRRHGGEKLSLSVEHRAQPGQQGIPLRLAIDGGHAALVDRERVETALPVGGAMPSKREILEGLPRATLLELVDRFEVEPTDRRRNDSLTSERRARRGAASWSASSPL